jgi:hypothetical protein
MKNIFSFEDFIFENVIHSSLQKSKDRGMSKLYNDLSTPSKKKLESAGKLKSIAFEEVNDPIYPDLSGDFLTFRFSDIEDPIPYPFLHYKKNENGEPSFDVNVPFPDEIRKYFSWVGKKLENPGYYTEEMIWKYIEFMHGQNRSYYVRHAANEIIYCYYDKYDRERSRFDISDLRYRDSDPYKNLMKIGCKETTSDLKMKNGTIEISIDYRIYSIHSNGYMRSKYCKEGRVSPILSNSIYAI